MGKHFARNEAIYHFDHIFQGSVDELRIFV